jgi:hypothetical protein
MPPVKILSAPSENPTAVICVKHISRQYKGVITVKKDGKGQKISQHK